MGNTGENMFTLNTLVEMILKFILQKSMDYFTDFNRN